MLERGRSVGESWRYRYERLHLHTPRLQSHLPGYRIPRRYGRWVARTDLVAYLEAYAAHHRIGPELGVEVRRIEREEAGWRLLTSDGERHARAVVIATGYSNVPYLPDWPGAEGFAGTLLHAAEYRRPDPYVDADVLVVGTGNSGAEIAADLAERGAGRVRLSVRTPPHIVPRTIAGLPTTLLGIVNEFIPARVGDPVNTALERLTTGDLSDSGLPIPSRGLLSQYRRTDQLPIIDVGLVSQLRAGRVEPVAAVEAFDHDRILLADGTRITADVVIAATGYRTGLEELVGHLGVLDERARPMAAAGVSDPAAPALQFVGLRNPLIGLLNAISLDARRAARQVVRELEAPPTRLGPGGRATSVAGAAGNGAGVRSSGGRRADRSRRRSGR